MSVVGFDTLRFARRLKDAGVPEKQAEAQAEVMAETFVYNMESLVTTDYLDARFAEQSEAFEKRFTAMDIKFTELKGELGLQRWILAAIAASTVLPALNSLFSLAWLT